MDASPKWRRRKTARPGEIEAAALEVFAAHGFAAAKLEDIAALAGLSKAALYLYFPTKLDLFNAVVSARAAPNLDAIAAALEAEPVAFADLATRLLTGIAVVLEQPQLRAMARMVIAESRNFPELARLWHDRVVARALTLFTRIIADGQTRGEVRPGDPRLMAMSMVGPMMMGAIYKDVLEPAGAHTIDLAALAAEHLATLKTGMTRTPAEERP
ncbi:MAG TPA: TetR/AcrR family transcriptional regulator [Caulobacteraceae bacterium]